MLVKVDWEASHPPFGRLTCLLEEFILHFISVSFVISYTATEDKDSLRERFQSIWIKVTGPVSFIIFLFQLKLDSSLPGPYFFIDFDWLSYSAMKLNFIG